MNQQNRQQHQEPQEYLDWRPYFPWHKYYTIRPDQKRMLEIVASKRRVVFEAPTGIGKTAVGYTLLKTLQALVYSQKLEGALLYVTPTKALVDQVVKLHPDVKVMYGRNEYECLWAKEQGFQATADDIPCLLIVKSGRCVHYDAVRGVGKAAPCPYYAAKLESERPGQIVVCTTAYFLLNKLYQDYPEKIAGLVIDEAHKIAQVARMVFTYDITDYHLNRMIELLKGFDFVQAHNLRQFLSEMMEIAQLKPVNEPTLLESHEIEHLLSYLKQISLEETRERIAEAIAKREIDPKEFREELMTFNRIGLNLKRYLSSFEYALAQDGIRNPLNYIFAFYQARAPKEQKVRCKLCMRAHYVGPLIKSCLKAEHVVAYSATIGTPKIFKFETGVPFKVHKFKSPFPPENARIYLPTDVPYLAVRARSPLDLPNTYDKIVWAASEFKQRGLRSLIVVQKDSERTELAKIAASTGLRAISYGNGLSAKDAASKFRDERLGDCLIGTAANYSHGLDLPKDNAPIIFFLRPGYPNEEKDPAAQFEIRRFGRDHWKLWRWRVIIEALQVRGRNIRSENDLGVLILMSQQFGRFLPGGLPEWLQDAWVNNLTMEEVVVDATAFLQKLERRTSG